MTYAYIHQLTATTSVITKKTTNIATATTTATTATSNQCEVYHLTA